MKRQHWASIALLVAAALIIGWALLGRGTAPGPSAEHTTTRSHATSSSTAAGTRTASARESGAKPGASASGALGTDSASGLAWVSPANLPPEARDTLALIDKGGPFPYPDHDGVVFSNAEGILPRQKSGYYHEYTVPTPGAPTRGARRIVTGSGREFYYTGDHYQSFQRIKR